MNVVIQLTIEGEAGDTRALLERLHASIGCVIGVGHPPSLPPVVEDRRSVPQADDVVPAAPPPPPPSPATAARVPSVPRPAPVAPPTAPAPERPPPPPRLARALRYTGDAVHVGESTDARPCPPAPSPILKVESSPAFVLGQVLAHLEAQLPRLGDRARLWDLFVQDQGRLIARRLAGDDARWRYVGSSRGLVNKYATIERVALDQKEDIDV